MEHFGTPHWHPHDMELLQAMKFELAQSYTSLLSRLESHAEDNTRHVTCEEKDTWNNKADKVQMRDLEMRMTEKADYNDLVELKEVVTKIKTAVDNGTTTSVGDIVTQVELDTAIESITSKLTNLRESVQTIQNNLNTDYFATVDWVNDQQFIKTADLKDAVVTAIASNKEVQNAIAGVVSDTIGDSVKSTITDDENVQNQIKQYITEIVGESTGNSDLIVAWTSTYKEGDSGVHKVGTLTINNTSIDIYDGGTDGQWNSSNNPDGYLTRDQIIELIVDQIKNNDTIKSEIAKIVSDSISNNTALQQAINQYLDSTITTRYRVQGTTLILA